MQPTRVTISDFRRSFAILRERALNAPVVITEDGRDSLVVMSAAEWKRLTRRDRHVGLAHELPEEWWEAVRSAEVPPEFAHLDDELK